MALTARRLADYVTNVLGGTPADEVSALDIVNHAARTLESSRKWKYLHRSTRAVDFRKPITGDGASYTTNGDGTGVLADVSGFTGYVFVPGDEVAVSLSGTLYGTYKVQSKDPTGQDYIVIESALGNVAASVLDYDINTSRLALPTDMGRIISVHGDIGGNLRALYPASVSELVEDESSFQITTGWEVGYAIEWNQATAKSQPVPTLRITPEPAAQEYSAISVVYYREWPTIDSDADVVPVPEYMEALLIQMCRAYAVGFDGGVEVGQRLAMMEQAINAVMGGSLYQIAAKHDGQAQLESGGARFRGISPGGDNISLSEALARSQTSGGF